MYTTSMYLSVMFRLHYCKIRSRGSDRSDGLEGALGRAILARGCLEKLNRQPFANVGIDEPLDHDVCEALDHEGLGLGRGRGVEASYRISIQLEGGWKKQEILHPGRRPRKVAEEGRCSRKLIG